MNGVCLEVSSAGLHKRHGKLYPNPALLSAARERDVPITLASDAHVPQNVGRGLDRAIEHARGAGYETVTVFDRRKPRQEPLG
jgi:histidinol-phosphatase (PHP family)